VSAKREGPARRPDPRNVIARANGSDASTLPEPADKPVSGIVIHRSYTVVPLDRRLSLAALGLLAYLLSLPPDQDVTAESLADRDSPQEIRAALRELRDAGYVTDKPGGA
jgi:hypothetical protein